MNRKLGEALGKIVAAAGWSDGTLTTDEIENLKDLLFQLQRSFIDPRQDVIFQMYIKSPVDEPERERLISELKDAIWSEADKTSVLSALNKMLEADGEVTGEEQAVLQQIGAALQAVDTGVFGDLVRLMRAALGQRSRTLRNAPNRERYFEDFVRNTVYYEVRRRLDLMEADLNIPDSEVRKLGFVGGMMARVAQTDQIVLEDEIDKITSILRTRWGLSLEAATLVTESALADVCKDFDYLRMAREYMELTTPAERFRLLDLLFAVANADGHVSNEEVLEITFIADYLLISLDRVNRALLNISNG